MAVLVLLYTDADASMYQEFLTTGVDKASMPGGGPIVTAFPSQTQRSLALYHATCVAASAMADQLQGASAAGPSNGASVAFGLSTMYDGPMDIVTPAEARMAMSRAATSLTSEQRQQQLRQPPRVPHAFTEALQRSLGARSSHDMRMEAGIDVAAVVRDAAAIASRAAKGEVTSLTVRVVVVGSRPHAVNVSGACRQAIKEFKATRKIKAVSVSYIDTSCAKNDEDGAAVAAPIDAVLIAKCASAADIGPLLLKAFTGTLHRVKPSVATSSNWAKNLDRHLRVLTRAPRSPPPSVTGAPLSASVSAARPQTAVAPETPPDVPTPAGKPEHVDPVDESAQTPVKTTAHAGAAAAAAGEPLSPDPPEPRRDSVLETIFATADCIPDVSPPQGGFPPTQSSPTPAMGGESGVHPTRVAADEQDGDADII